MIPRKIHKEFTFAEASEKFRPVRLFSENPCKIRKNVLY